jgi:nitrite reductase/ring-hydroxylating ferredoxin subunit
MAGARHRLGPAAEIPPGRRQLFEVAGRQIGVFNVDGRFHALRNVCPHGGGPLCEGRLTGTTLTVEDRSYRYGREGRILRCAWHGWEFELETGQALADPRVRARTYPITVEDGQLVVEI